MAGDNTMNYARVTDFRREATGQMFAVVVMGAAKQIPLRISSQMVIALGNGKFIARRSHAISARQSGCAAFDPFHLSRFAKGANVSRSLLADSGVAGVSSGRLPVAMSTPTIEAKAASFLLSQELTGENGLFQRLGSFRLLVTIVLLIRWRNMGEPYRGAALIYGALRSKTGLMMRPVFIIKRNRKGPDIATVTKQL
jgi:hypothetical protein